MKKYIVVLKKEIPVRAGTEQEAEDIVIEQLSDDVEALMPQNLDVEIMDGSHLPDNYFIEWGYTRGFNPNGHRKDKGVTNAWK